MSKLILTHLIFGGGAAICLFLSMILFIFKFGEIGMGPGLSWLTIIGVGVLGILLIALDVLLIRRFIRS